MKSKYQELVKLSNEAIRLAGIHAIRSNLLLERDQFLTKESQIKIYWASGSFSFRNSKIVVSVVLSICVDISFHGFGKIHNFEYTLFRGQQSISFDTIDPTSKSSTNIDEIAVFLYSNLVFIKLPFRSRFRRHWSLLAEVVRICDIPTGFGELIKPVAAIV